MCVLVIRESSVRRTKSVGQPETSQEGLRVKEIKDGQGALYIQQKWEEVLFGPGFRFFIRSRINKIPCLNIAANSLL